MVKSFINGALCLLLLCFVSASFAKPVNTAILIGTWGNSEDGGETFWGYANKPSKNGGMKSLLIATNK